MEAFKEYLHKYCVKHEIPEDEALTHAIVRSVAEAYGVDLEERNENHEH